MVEASSVLLPSTTPTQRQTSKRIANRISTTSSASELGLHTRLETEADPWGAPPSRVERAEAERLSTFYHAMADGANKSSKKLDSALVFLRSFREKLPSRTLFLSLDTTTPARATRHNRETLGMLTAHIRETGSIQKGRKGETLSAGTIQSYVDAIAHEVSVSSLYQIRGEGTDHDSGRAAKFMRGEDGKKTQRKLRRGIRAMHFKRACSSGKIDRFGPAGCRRYARCIVSHSLLLRGGEPGVEDETGAAGFDPAEGHMTGASVTWFTAAEMGKGYPAVRVFVMPIKDSRKTYRPVPQFIPRRNGQDIALGADPVCAYDALLLLWQQDFSHLTQTELAKRPLFASDDDKAVTTSIMRKDALWIAGAADLPLTEVGSTSFRIGGAEDFYDEMGVEAEPAIKERGRWCSDIHQLYQRCTITRHLDGARRMGDSAGISLEALGGGWANPGRR